MSYPGLIAPMIEAMQKQQAEIKELWVALGVVFCAGLLGLVLVRRPSALKALPLILFVLICFAAGSSYAACSSPAGNERDIRYNGDYHTYQFCNGTTWLAVGGGGAAARFNPDLDADRERFREPAIHQSADNLQHPFPEL